MKKITIYLLVALGLLAVILFAFVDSDDSAATDETTETVSDDSTEADSDEATDDETVALAQATAVKADGAKVYLVAVGISDYPGKVNDLTLCADDATDVAELYQKNSETVTVLLCDRKATTTAVKKAMTDLFTKAGPNDIVVLYYSGHGEKKGLCLYDRTLSFKEIMKIFENLRCKNKMIFSDSCFSGSIRSNATIQQSDVSLTNNVMYFMGSRSNEYSIENGYDFNNSYFTHALIRALSGKADTNKDRVISAKELFVYVSSHVKEYSDDEQHPVMWGHFSDNMPVMVW